MSKCAAGVTEQIKRHLHALLVLVDGNRLPQQNPRLHVYEIVALLSLRMLVSVMEVEHEIALLPIFCIRHNGAKCISPKFSLS